VAGTVTGLVAAVTSAIIRAVFHALARVEDLPDGTLRGERHR